MLGIKRHSSSEAETFVLWMMKRTSRSKSGSVTLSLCAAELRGGFNTKGKYPELKENKGKFAWEEWQDQDGKASTDLSDAGSRSA